MKSNRIRKVVNLAAYRLAHLPANLPKFDQADCGSWNHALRVESDSTVVAQPKGSIQLVFTMGGAA